MLESCITGLTLLKLVLQLDQVNTVLVLINGTLLVVMVMLMIQLALLNVTRYLLGVVTILSQQVLLQLMDMIVVHQLHQLPVMDGNGHQLDNAIYIHKP